jgi:hypothetical protein
MSTYGEISWDDEVSTEKKNNKDTFLRLEEGANVVRLVTKPYQYLVHRYKKEGDPGYGQKVYCSTPADGKCPLCVAGDKAKPRWFIGVLDKKSQSVKILDISFSVFSQIRNLARNTDVWGDPQKYDINIFVNKNGGATGYYSVQPIPHKPLAVSEQQLKDNFDMDDLSRKVTPPTSDQVETRLAKINAATIGKPAFKTAATKVVKSTPVVDVSSDDDGDVFPEFSE